MGLGGKNILINKINKMNKTNKMAAKVFTCLLMGSTDSSGGARKGRREIKRKNGAGDKMSIALIRRRRGVLSRSLPLSLTRPQVFCLARGGNNGSFKAPPPGSAFRNRRFEGSQGEGEWGRVWGTEWRPVKKKVG